MKEQSTNLRDESEDRSVTFKLSVLGAALFIVFSPALVQLFNVDIPQIRPWSMYGSVGMGAPYGQFIIERGKGSNEILDLRQVKGHDRTRAIQRYWGSGQLKEGFNAQSTILDAGTSLCENLEEGDQLEFTGRLAQSRTWLHVKISHEDLCLRESY